MKESVADGIMMKATRAYIGKRIRMVTGSVPRISRPVLFAANHPTTLDPLLLQYALGLSYSSLLTEAAFALPLVRSVLVGARHVPVGERGSGGKALIERIAATARSGRPLAIFPEGCLSSGPGIAPLRSGAVRIAATARLPIVPVGIAVSEEGVKEVSMMLGGKLETGRYLLHGWYVVRVGRPISFDLSPDDRLAVESCTGELGQALKHQAREAQTLLAILEGREETEANDGFSALLASS
jgi:1-acyl-sn-glycerol-3-phosphate acyltransferase